MENAQAGKGDLSVAEAQAQVTAAQEAVDISNRELIFYSGDGANGTIRISFE